jgi:hypothetical protein
MAVPPFAKQVLSGLGLRVGKTAAIQCYTEVGFKSSRTTKDRPDGLIVLSTGRNVWRALVEAKCGNAELKGEQLSNYLDLAKELGIDAVITISNQLTALPTHHPADLPKKPPKGVHLFHWSWMHLLTEATLLVSQPKDSFDDPEQRYILSEVVRYLRHPNSGIHRFDRMNPEWKDLVSSVHSGASLQKNSKEVVNSVASWHQEQRDVCLELSRQLGRGVGLKLAKKEAENPELRLKEDCDVLIRDHKLQFTLDVPDIASPIDVVADIRLRNITCSMRLAAPQDRKSTSARVNWLTRQLPKTDNEHIHIRANWPGRAQATQAPITRVKEDPSSVENDNVGKAVGSFEVLLIKDLAGDFGRNVKFIERLEEVVPEFYEHVAQHLREWIPSPPKIQKDVLSGKSSEDTSQPQSARPVSAEDPPQHPSANTADDRLSQSRQSAVELSAMSAMLPDDQRLSLPWLSKNEKDKDATS